MSRAVRRFSRFNTPLPLLTVPMMRTTWFFLVDNQICLANLDWIANASAISANAEANMASSLGGALGPAWRAMLANDCFLTAVKVTCLTIVTRMPATFTFAVANQPGTGGASHLPSEMAIVTTKQTAIKGQHGRGRFYQPGIPLPFVTASSDANRLNAAGSTAQGTFVSAVAGTTFVDGTTTYSPGLATRVPRGQPVTNGGVLTLIVGRVLLGVIRRRRIGRGK